MSPGATDIMEKSDEAPDFTVHPHELGIEVSSDEIIFMQQLESQWKKFMSENPQLHPRGRRASKLAVLAKQIHDTKKAEEKVGQELEQQLEFFEESREALEDTYASEVDYANNLQKAIHIRLEKQLEDVAMTEHLMKQTLPWEFFLEAADMKAIPHVGASGPPDGGIRPSARALALIAPDGDPQDARLRAMRMDHALLTTQIKLLEKETQRVDLTNTSLAFVGKFLTEHNVWGILQKQENQHQEKQQEQQEQQLQHQLQQHQLQQHQLQQQQLQQQQRQQQQQLHQHRKLRAIQEDEWPQEEEELEQQQVEEENERQRVAPYAKAPPSERDFSRSRGGKHSVDAPEAYSRVSPRYTKQDP